MIFYFLCLNVDFLIGLMSSRCITNSGQLQGNYLSSSRKFTRQSTGIWISVWQNINATLLLFLLLLIRSLTHICPLYHQKHRQWNCINSVAKMKILVGQKALLVKQISHLVKLNFLLIKNKFFVFKLLGSLGIFCLS